MKLYRVLMFKLFFGWASVVGFLIAVSIILSYIVPMGGRYPWWAIIFISIYEMVVVTIFRLMPSFRDIFHGVRNHS